MKPHGRRMKAAQAGRTQRRKTLRARGSGGEKEPVRRIRELDARNEELEAALQAVSHDLRSPLVNVQGFVMELVRACNQLNALVEETPGRFIEKEKLVALFSQDLREALTFIRASVERMEKLLSELLRFSRLARMAPDFHPLDMNAMLRQIAQTVEFRLRRTGARLVIEDLPEAMGDAAQIHQVFSNLIDNALKYLEPSRRGEIRVSGRVNGSSAVYAVEDNGIGVPPEERERIFRLFHRVDPAATDGEGLGLAISRRILQRHNGKIWVESEPGAGSTFFVSLPRRNRRSALEAKP